VIVIIIASNLHCDWVNHPPGSSSNEESPKPPTEWVPPVPQTPPDTPATDVLAQPMVLVRQPYDQITVHGVKLGDDIKRLLNLPTPPMPPNGVRTASIGDALMYMATNGDDVINIISICARPAVDPLKSLNLTTESSVQSVFGKADDVKTEDKTSDHHQTITELFYNTKHVEVDIYHGDAEKDCFTFVTLRR
jgi:hypothetical protein